MIYLISQMALWLLATAGFSAIAGWAFAAERTAPAERALKREREKLLRDLLRFTSGESVDDAPALQRESDAMNHLMQVRDGRIAELERALEEARSRANEAAGRIAELERTPGSGASEAPSGLRAREDERAREIEVEAQPVRAEEERALQTWRLRYFEQRVKYLEGKAAGALAAGAVALGPGDAEWRAREAEARAAHLEQEVRALNARAASGEDSSIAAFAANADVDTLVRWRMLYLERRAAHLKEQTTAAQIASGAAGEAPDRDFERFKWRAHYLEARVRHLEQRPPAMQAAMPAAASATRPAPQTPAPPARRARPVVLASARNGAADDFTLIEGVSVLQQNTLYSLGVFHFDQIAAWTPENVAWVDQYLRLGGRIDAEEWVEQAGDLAREGVGARRLHEVEGA